MAIGRLQAIDAAPACRPQRSGGWRPGDFLVSRGMGAAQGKKVSRRHCGTGDRGEAGLRPDQPIEEAAWSARSGRENQGEPGDSIVQPRGRRRRRRALISRQGDRPHQCSRWAGTRVRPARCLRGRGASSRGPIPRSNAARDRWAQRDPALVHRQIANRRGGDRRRRDLVPAGSRNGVRRAPRPGRSHRARGQRRQPGKSGDGDDNGSCHREGDLPGFRGHRVLHDAMCRVIAGDGGRCDESGGNHKPQPERPDECEQDVTSEKGCEAGDRSNGDSAEPAGACAVRPDACRDPCE